MLIIAGLYLVLVWLVFSKLKNGFQTIRKGTPVQLVFDNHPGRLFDAAVTEIPQGVGQGQIAASGTLARTTAIGGATTFPATVSIPPDLDRQSLRLGMSGNATAYSAKAGVIGLIAWALLWVSA